MRINALVTRDFANRFTERYHGGEHAVRHRRQAEAAIASGR